MIAPWHVREHYLQTLMRLQLACAREANAVQPGEPATATFLGHLRAVEHARELYVGHSQ